MRIAFICGSLERGKDGVGDYTHLLADECEEQGHSCLRIALNDTWLQDNGDDKDDVSGKDVDLARFSARTPWDTRVKKVAALLDRFKPDAVSFQFVSYGFHPKGKTGEVARYLHTLRRPYPCHIMLHELWPGSRASNAHWLRKLQWAAQKRQTLRFVRDSGALVHTSNDLYQTILARNGVTAGVLPLFGNIPIVAGGRADHWLFPMLQAQGVDINEANKSQFLLGGFFGTMYPEWKPNPFLAELYQAVMQNSPGRQLLLLSTGRTGGGFDLERQKELTRDLPPHSFVALGEQPAPRVSEFLQSIDFGIPTTNLTLLGKSGVVAAMLEHGVPLLASRIEEGGWPSAALRAETTLIAHRMRTLIHPLYAPITAQTLRDLVRLPPLSYKKMVAADLLIALRKITL